MKTSTIFKYAFYFIYAICSMQFFNYVEFSNTFVKMGCFIIHPLMFLLCFDQIRRRSSHPLYRYMQWILASLSLSFISAWVFWGQGIILTYRSTAPMLAFMFFFYLCKKNPPVEFLERFVWIFSIIYCIFWLYAFSQIPIRVFGVSEDGMVNDDISRGIIRIGVAGKSFVIMALFLSVNKFYTTSKKYFLALAALFFLFIFLSVTRQIIVFSALVVAGYIYLKNKKASIAVVAVVVVFSLLGNGIKISDDSIAGSLLNITESQYEKNERGEDIRITEYKYFFGKYSKNIITSIIGNGMPHADSSYGHFYKNLEKYDALYLVDVGYAMMYAVTGVLGLVLYLLLFFKSALTKVPDELAYARMYMIYFIPANIAASWYAKPDYQICMTICIYILMVYGENKNKHVANGNSYTQLQQLRGYH